MWIRELRVVVICYLVLKTQKLTDTNTLAKYFAKRFSYEIEKYHFFFLFHMGWKDPKNSCLLSVPEKSIFNCFRELNISKDRIKHTVIQCHKRETALIAKVVRILVPDVCTSLSSFQIN